MSKTEQFTPEQIIKAVQGTAGIYLAIAKNLKCDRSTVSIYVKRYPEISKAIDNERLSLIDVCEGKLVRLINDGNFKAIQFFLKTKGKDRGYTEDTSQRSQEDIKSFVALIREATEKNQLEDKSVVSVQENK